MSGANPLIIPTQPVPSQTLFTVVSNQSTQINIYAKNFMVPADSGIPTDPPTFREVSPLFMDVYLNDAIVIGCVLCRNNTLIIRSAYLGFVGDFTIVDTIGNDDPVYTGLGARFQLVYWPNSK